MARDIVEVELDGSTYSITKIDPFKSFRIFTRLTKIVAPAGSKLAEAGLKSKGAEELLQRDVSWFVEVVQELADRLDEAELEKTLRELLEPVMKDGRKLNPLVDFAGDVPLMLRVAAEVIRVEYGGFLQFLPSRPSSGGKGES